MSRKVELCGVDTSKLPRLTAAEAAKLMTEVKKGDTKARSVFIMSNIRLVLSVVQRYCMRSANIDDLFQVGCVGLVKAVDNFDVKQQVLFSTYAVPMIEGEIKRNLRESNSMRVSRGIRDAAYVAMLARDRLERTSSNEVTIDDIAKELNQPVSQVRFVFDSVNHPISLYDPIYSDGDDSILVMDQIRDIKSDDSHWLNNLSLSQAIITLDKRERQILKKRYYEGKTQIEVSKEVGLSQAQVSRLEKSAVAHIRELIETN